MKSIKITDYNFILQAITPPVTTAGTQQPQQGPPPSAAILAANVITATLQGQEAVSSHGGFNLFVRLVRHLAFLKGVLCLFIFLY